MLLTEFDREWAEYVAGRRLSDQEVVRFKQEYSSWVTEVENSLECGPEMFTEH